MKRSRFALLSFLPRLGGRRASFKIGVVATLTIAVAANIAVLGNLGVLFGHVVPGAQHQNLLVPYFQPLQYKALSPSQWGIYRPVYDRLTDSLTGHADLALYKTRDGMLGASDSRNPTRFVYLYVTPSLAQVLGVHAVSGRMFTTADEKRGAALSIMISERVARTRFGSSGAAVNKTLSLNGKIYLVVGVLPDMLAFPSSYPAAGWVPFPPQAPGLVGNIGFGLHALVRPHPGFSASAIRAALSRAYTQALPDYNSGMRSFIKQMQLAPRVETLAQREYGPVTAQLQLIELASLLLLLLVFANLAGLATSDALARRHELATRVALGGGTWQLFLERARELALLGVVGWGIGVGLGWLGARALAAVIGQAGPAVAFSIPVLLLTLAAVLMVTTLLATGGIWRLHTPRVLCADLMTGGYTSGRGLVRTLRAFIVLQLAISVVLLVMAGHLRVNVFGLMHGDLGFTPAQRTFFLIALPGGERNQTDAQYKVYVANASAFDHGFLDRLNKLDGIKSAALLSVMPFSGSSATINASTSPSMKKHGGIVNIQTVSKHIAQTLGLRVLAGNTADVFSDNGNVVFLDEAAIKRFWPNLPTARVIGRSLYVGDKAWRVAAIVDPLRMKPYGSVGGTLFTSYENKYAISSGPQSFVVHSALATNALRKAIVHVVQAVNPQAKLLEFKPAGKIVAKAYAGRTQLGRVFGTLAIVAMLIAAVGLFALLAYRSLVRRPEFAIRGAMGATPGRLLGSVLTEALVLWIIGCVIGVPAAYALSVVLASHLPKLGLPAIWVTASVVACVGVTAFVAALVPARRAARVDFADNLST